MKQIALTKGLSASVDDADYERLNRYNWQAETRKRGRVYARRTAYAYKGSTSAYLHREVLMAPPNAQVDHIDGNGLNCQRSNLRLVTNRENHRAFRRKAQGKSSRFRGVSWIARDSKWYASIIVDYKTIGIGRYLNEEDAARAYDAAAVKFFGVYACKNLP